MKKALEKAIQRFEKQNRRETKKTTAALKEDGECPRTNQLLIVSLRKDTWRKAVFNDIFA
ncbi:MAG: hypothetical protein JSW04_14660 [Desulfobacterales bacterium]|nr:MAG: hypothetical protein JSW04_14660 [Desulfobacterales bacterium]